MQSLVETEILIYFYILYYFTKKFRQVKNSLKPLALWFPNLLHLSV